MTWSELTADWALYCQRMQARFPRLDHAAMDRSKHDRARFEAYLAETHNLSLNEAREEIEDFLYVEALAREASPVGR